MGPTPPPRLPSPAPIPAIPIPPIPGRTPPAPIPKPGTPPIIPAPAIPAPAIPAPAIPPMPAAPIIPSGGTCPDSAPGITTGGLPSRPGAARLGKADGAEVARDIAPGTKAGRTAAACCAADRAAPAPDMARGNPRFPMPSWKLGIPGLPGRPAWNPGRTPSKPGPGLLPAGIGCGLALFLALIF